MVLKKHLVLDLVLNEAILTTALSQIHRNYLAALLVYAFICFHNSPMLHATFVALTILNSEYKNSQMTLVVD